MTDRQINYDNWVQRVCAFLAEEGPKLNKHCASFQSKPILDKQPDVVFLGYNPHENWEYFKEDSQPERFYEGNPSFCNPEMRKRGNWKIWNRIYDAFDWAEYTRPVEDGNFVFFNAVYFGSDNIQEMKSIPSASEAIDKCLDFTSEVIQEIFKPKCVVCFSIPDCFDLLNLKFSFTDNRSIKLNENIAPHLTEFAIKKCWKSGVPNSNRTIKTALWNGIPVYGIPHPSGLNNYDDWGLIALFLRNEMEKLL